MHHPKIYAGHIQFLIFSSSHWCIGMISIIGLLIIELWCTNVTFGKYITQVTNTATTMANTTELISTAKHFFVVFPETYETTYCAITACETITCTSILLSDPGTFVSNFIGSTFKIQCPTTKTINLIFQDCQFAGGKLKNSWLISSIGIGIDDISFKNCQLSEIDVGAFASKVFENTTRFTIINTQITSLKCHVFQEMNNLRSLMIHDNVIDEVEYDLLSAVAGSLQTIELDRSIMDPKVLLNITTGKQLSQVQLVSLRGNNIPNLAEEIFNSFPSVSSLYIDSSNIVDIDVNTFVSTRFIQQIFMNNNLIKTLPSGLFNTILLYNPNLKLSITDNPWHCNCQLKWMQQMMIEHPKVLMTIPSCYSPEINNGKSFLLAEFCPETDNETIVENNTSLVDINSTTEMQNNTEDNDREFIEVSCENSKILQLVNLHIKFLNTFVNELSKKSTSDFSLHKYDNRSVTVNTNSNETITTILWFNIDMNKTGDINCIKNIGKSIILLNNLDEDSTYIICILKKMQLVLSSLNCLALNTDPPKNTKVWLMNDDKAIVLSVYSLTLILFGLLSSGVCLLIVRKNPSILRGSSRVIMVRRGHVKALILPKGVCYSDIQRQRVNKKLMTSRETTNPNYLTPIETRKSHISNVYESISNKIISTNYFDVDEPPPLPPHPRHGVYENNDNQHQQYQQRLPSLSLKIDMQHDEMVDDEPYQNEENNTGIYSGKSKHSMRHMHRHFILLAKGGRHV